MLSMWPLIQSNDQIADAVKQKNYSIDDIIIFKESTNLVAHRIIYKPLFSPGYITKGDNNRVSDRPVLPPEIFGKVLSIKRGKSIVSIESLYKQQSNQYLQSLNEFKAASLKHKLPYLILKGMPLYQQYLKSYPRHYIYDADILIHPADLGKLRLVLNDINYSISHIRPGSAEFSAFKHQSGLPLSLDIHLEPAVGFSQFPRLNALLPQLKDLTIELWKTSKNHHLTPDHQLIYLLLHALHHAYTGTTRWDLIGKVIKHPTLNKFACVEIINRLKLDNLVYGSLIFYERYYGDNLTTKTILKNLKPSASVKLLAFLVAKFFKPWTYHHHFFNRLELLLYLVIVSPHSVLKKISILFYSITSMDFKVFMNWIKSRLA